MARTNIVEVSDADALVAYTDRFFRRVSATTPAIPASYAGKYAAAILVATDTQVSEAQMDALETAIEAITGVHKAFVLIGPARIPTDRVPTDTAENTYSLHINVEAGFNVVATPALP